MGISPSRSISPRSTRSLRPSAELVDRLDQGSAAAPLHAALDAIGVVRPLVFELGAAAGLVPLAVHELVGNGHLGVLQGCAGPAPHGRARWRGRRYDVAGGGCRNPRELRVVRRAVPLRGRYAVTDGVARKARNLLRREWRSGVAAVSPPRLYICTCRGFVAENLRRGRRRVRTSSAPRPRAAQASRHDRRTDLRFRVRRGAARRQDDVAARR